MTLPPDLAVLRGHGRAWLCGGMLAGNRGGGTSGPFGGNGPAQPALTAVVHAELPGIDPAKDVKISYAGGELKLEVERAESHKDRGHSEFR